MKRPCLAVALSGLLAVPAAAADIAPRAYTKAPPPVVAVYNWTGFYIGGNIGYGWGQNTARSISFVDPGGAVGFGPYFAGGSNVFPNLRPAGVIGGGQVGYNWQMNALVWALWPIFRRLIFMPLPRLPCRSQFSLRHPINR